MSCSEEAGNYTDGEFLLKRHETIQAGNKGAGAQVHSKLRCQTIPYVSFSTRLNQAKKRADKNCRLFKKREIYILFT